MVNYTALPTGHMRGLNRSYQIQGLLLRRDHVQGQVPHVEAAALILQYVHPGQILHHSGLHDWRQEVVAGLIVNLQIGDTHLPDDTK